MNGDKSETEMRAIKPARAAGIPAPAGIER